MWQWIKRLFIKDKPEPVIVHHAPARPRIEMQRVIPHEQYIGIQSTKQQWQQAQLDEWRENVRRCDELHRELWARRQAA